MQLDWLSAQSCLSLPGLARSGACSFHFAGCQPLSKSNKSWQIPVIDMTVRKNTIDTHEMALMRPAMRVVTKVAEEEVDLEGAVQNESGTNGQLQKSRIKLLDTHFRTFTVMFQ